jgi:hypothetical protein
MLSLNENKLHLVFKILLLLTMLLSFYFFISKVFLNSNTHNDMFNTWQFPVLIAVLLDVLYK